MATIGTNLAAVAASNYLTINSTQQTNDITRLASGTRLAIPYDDAAGVAVSGNLSARIKRLSAASNTVQDLVSYAQTTDGFLSTIQSITTRLSELTQELTNGAFSTADRNNYLTEAQILTAQFQTITATANFNGQLTLSGAQISAGFVIAVDSVGTTDALSTSNISAALQSVSGIFKFYSSSGAAGAALNITGAVAQISAINQALTSITTTRASVNAQISKFNFYITNIQTENVNVTTANSRISDLNVAQASTDESKQSILVQAATSVLAQANTSQQSILALLH